MGVITSAVCYGDLRFSLLILLYDFGAFLYTVHCYNNRMYIHSIVSFYIETKDLMLLHLRLQRGNQPALEIPVSREVVFLIEENI